MNFTATLLAQILTFAVLVWFVQRFLWGPLTNMLEERKKRIAEGLAAAERGQHEQELGQKRATEIMQHAKSDAAEIVNQAQKRAAEIIDQAKQDARSEGQRLIAAAQAEIEQESNRAREQLREKVGELAVAAAEKILQKEINAAAHKNIVDSFARQI